MIDGVFIVELNRRLHDVESLNTILKTSKNKLTEYLSYFLFDFYNF